MRETFTVPHNPAGLNIDQQTRAQREADFQANIEGHIALTLHKHSTILDRIAATLEALVPRDTPAQIREMILAPGATAYSSWEIRLPDGVDWQLAAILPLSEVGASGAHELDIAGLLSDTFQIAFTAGDPNARIEGCNIPVPRSFVLRVRDSGAGSGNTCLALRFEPARW